MTNTRSAVFAGMGSLRKAPMSAALLGLAMLLATSAASADDAPLHTFHCLFGCPVGAPANDDLVVREIYTLAANPLTRLSDWVAYRITPETIAKSKTRNWLADPWLATDETLAPDDYDGASDALRVDRGHQAPLAALSGTPTWPDANILSNITPQSSALNEGPWQRLEARETALVKKSKAPLYVLTGPLFERLMRGLPAMHSLHRVPSGYWKVIATSDGRMSAFVFDQQAGRGDDYCAARTQLAEIELRSRLRFFPGPQTPSDWGSLDADLGCQTPPPARPEPEEVRPEPPR